MKKKYVVSLWMILLFSCSKLQAQQQEVVLQEITIYGIPTEKYAAGAKIYQADSLSLQQFATENLSELLTSRTAVYMKNYGNGMASTIAFRGTSPSHTAVLWNGFTINQPTLGQTDFSIIPLAAFDHLQIQYGSASSLFGSDAIGGSIYLSSQPSWQNKLEAHIRQELASFTSTNTQAVVRLSTDKIESKTSAYYNFSENNFSYKNTSRSGAPTERQTHARLAQTGFTQDLYYRKSANRYFAFKSWYNSINREIQPIIGIKESDETQQDQNLRLAGEFHQQTKVGYTSARAGFISDILNFKKPSSLIDSRALTNKLIGRLEHEVSLNTRMAVRAGAEAMLIEAEVNGYNRSISENRGDIFLLFRYQLHPRWLTSFHLRKAFVEGYQPPLAPAFGSEYLLWKNSYHKVLIKSGFSRSYRVPTLNERYWNPGGNIHLRPEDAIGGEAGVAYTFLKYKIRAHLEITHYHNRINQLIQWQPDTESALSIWSPKNLQRVYSRGMEVSATVQAKLQAVQVESGLQYAFTRSTQEKVNSSHDLDLKGKQVMYVPFHNGVWYGNILFKRWLLGANLSYTGYRYTNSSNTNRLDAFALLDFSAGKTFHFHHWKLQLLAKANNVGNTNYQTIEARAMPGRNYALSLNIFYHPISANKP
jgi:iron complex outermembrane receptor protein